MNEQQEILLILGKVGAVITNTHAVLTSGEHSTAYINKDAIYPHTWETSHLCRIIAKQFLNDGVEVVIAPAIGGVALSQWTTHHLSDITGRKVLAVYAEKEGLELVSSSYGPLPPKYEDRFVIKRGYDKLIPGKRVLVVGDVLTTGASTRKVIEAVRLLRGNVVGLGVICNRGRITSQGMDVPKLIALVNVWFDTWDEADCPLCKQGVPINTDVGWGREFLARHSAKA